MSILKFNVGRRGASGSHTSYITRGNACDSISFHNLDELESESEYEKRVNALSYSHNREEEELSKNENGRTHYRVILSWEGKEDTEKAKEQAHEFLDNNFEKGRGVVAIHQDTDHTHAHVWLDSRQTDNKKIHLDKKSYKELDERWAKQYDREYQTNRAEEYRAKKQETREYKKAKANGLDVEKPERSKMDSDRWREKDARDAGVNQNYGTDKERLGRNQQSFAVRDSGTKEADNTINQSQQRTQQTEHSIAGSQQKSARTNRESRDTIRETEKLRESVEEYSRTVKSKKIEKDFER